MDRITNKQLESLVSYLNKITNSPDKSYSIGEDGLYHANPGCYCLDGAYGGVNLNRICNDGGGVNTPLGGGFYTKKELYNKISAFIKGIEEGKSLNRS